MAHGNKADSSKPSPIRAVILDYGEVLCFQPEPEALGRMAKIFRIAPEHFLERYARTRGPYDQGVLTAEDYWEGFARDAGVGMDAALLEKLRAWDTDMWSRINDKMTAWVEKLHAAGLTTALLSNMQSDMAAFARKNFAWLARFDHQIFSCEVRLIKPDPTIFRHTIQCLNLEPHAILFVDDRQANVEAATAAGLRALRFQSIEQLTVELEKMGFGILPRDGRSKVC
jgi:putative hydrolase of the HAD superfamily